MEEQLKVTCLHDSHVALGAKMSPFAGFDMPIQYSSITEEHLAVRNNVGMFDVSHMGEIFVSGPDAEKFVNHIFTNDIRPMVPGQVLYGMMLYPDGGTVDDLLVYKEFTADHYLLVVNAANIEKDFLWIKDHAEGYDVKLVNDSDNWGQIALQGPKAEETLVKVLGYQPDILHIQGFRGCRNEGHHQPYRLHWRGRIRDLRGSGPHREVLGRFPEGRCGALRTRLP